MTSLLRLMVPAVVALLLASPATACPLCESETGQQVRAAIFDDDFGKKVFLTLLPFPVLAGIVALIYYGPPDIRRTRRNPSDHSGPVLSPPG
jgi:hypothetical protein